MPDTAGLERLWALHPDAFHRIQMHGKEVATTHEVPHARSRGRRISITARAFET